MRPTPADYAERVYAGVLGKIIGVYLGRPFENWSHQRIQEQLGEVRYYVNGHPAIPAVRRDNPLVQPDDDISGTFGFLRALPDCGNRRDVSAAQIGQTWLNYLVEERSTLWWGGIGLSTEHTCYLRLKEGVEAPESGSAGRNGTVLAEQIGAQIFIDGWAMVAPGDPELAADLARRAASVSHDGESILAAQVLAAMEAHAFVEPDLDALLDTAVALIDDDSATARMIHDVRTWHATEPNWRRTRALIETHHGYEHHAGNAPVIPNQALIVHALLHGRGDFHESLAIVNTSGWDTDCNSGNLGCLLGIRGGLAALEGGPDWRGPVADRLYVSTADGGGAISDAVVEAQQIVGIGRALAGEPPSPPKEGARFNFHFPGSVQGFAVQSDHDECAAVENVEMHSASGRRSLALHLSELPAGRAVRLVTPTFTPPEAIPFTDDGLLASPWLHPGKYALVASPTLYPGQEIVARVEADGSNSGAVSCRIATSSYARDDTLRAATGTPERLPPGEDRVLRWRVPDADGQPIAEVGIEVASDEPLSGTLRLDYLRWDGAPDVTLGRPAEGGTMWRRAWVPGVDRFEPHAPEPYTLIQNRGRGLLIQGTREWDDYEVSASVRPRIAIAAGIAARVQGLRRYYALVLCGDATVRLIKARDGDRVLAAAPFACEYGAAHELALRVQGRTIAARIDGETVFECDDANHPLTQGAVGFVCEEGCVTSEAMTIRPLNRTSERP